jgi:Tetratricopeptide repeat
MNNLAEVLSNHGKFKDAEEMYRQVLTMTGRILGKEQPDSTHICSTGLRWYA